MAVFAIRIKKKAQPTSFGRREQPGFLISLHAEAVQGLSTLESTTLGQCVKSQDHGTRRSPHRARNHRRAPAMGFRTPPP